MTYIQVITLLVKLKNLVKGIYCKVEECEDCTITHIIFEDEIVNDKNVKDFLNTLDDYCYAGCLGYYDFNDFIVETHMASEWWDD